MKNKGLVAAIVVLALAVGILAYINAAGVSELDEAALVLKIDGEEVAVFSLKEITDLGGEQFSAVLRASGKTPQENIYTGLPLIDVLEAMYPGAVREGAQVSVQAIDGYAVAYSSEDLRRPGHIYLVWQKDGAGLGSKGENGLGPLLVIPRLDEFGQYWCKFVVLVDVR